MVAFSLVTTTINVPHLLDEYAKDAKRFGRDLAEIIVVGDRKTPDDTAGFCAALEKRWSISCRYVSVKDQEAYLARWPDFASFLPWNCIQRRNVGLMLAYESKTDVIITIDDDNFLAQTDYLGAHAHLGAVQDVSAVRSQSGWWNVCEMLKEERGIPFYHRGHPLSKRWHPDEVFKTVNTVRGRVVVNAGLWLDDPDVDALTRLFFPVRAAGTSQEFQPRIACDLGTMAPFNSQNTALVRDVIPAYLLFPHIGRYDDIWASYVVRRIADSFGEFVTYGNPLVRQKRNPHNYLKDFEAEKFGLDCNDAFLQALTEMTIEGDSYQCAFSGFSRQFPEMIGKACEEHKKNLAEFDNVKKGLELWSQVFS